MFNKAEKSSRLQPQRVSEDDWPTNEFQRPLFSPYHKITQPKIKSIEVNALLNYHRHHYLDRLLWLSDRKCITKTPSNNPCMLIKSVLLRSESHIQCESNCGASGIFRYNPH